LATAVRPLFGPFVLLAQEVSFGGIQSCVERQPQLRVDMHQGDKLFCCADQCNPSVGLQGSRAKPCLSRSLIPEKLDGLATGMLPELKLVKFSSVSIRVATGDPDR
jgi:hypothetical protein